MTFISTIQKNRLAIFLATVALIFMWRRGSQKRKARVLQEAAELRNLFSPGTEFIGKDIHFLILKAGNYDGMAYCDHGRSVAHWSAGDVLVELWFYSGRCTDIDVKFGS